MQICFICGGELRNSSSDYRKCGVCGHEILTTTTKTGIVVNDRLDEAALKRVDRLIREQRALVNRIVVAHNFLLDIGCGSGRFLFHAGKSFAQTLGVEVSDLSADFARRVFKLEVVDILPADLNPPSVATFWHSLEHLPASAMRDILSRLQSASSAETRIIVSVPNAASLQHQWFGTKYAYYDVPAHLHQFTPRSLDLLMAQHGFERAGRTMMLSYITFGWIQGLLNEVLPIPNYLYYRLKRGWDFRLSPLKRWCHDVFSFSLLPIIIPFAGILTLMECGLSDHQGVLTAWYRKHR